MTPEQIERLKEYVEVTKELSGLSFWEAQRIADLRALLAEWEERGRELALREQAHRDTIAISQERGREIERLKAEHESFLKHDDADRRSARRNLQEAEARLAKVVETGQKCGLAVSHGWVCPAAALAAAQQKEEKSPVE